MITDNPAERDVLRALARRANGLSGADIERLVREARQSARRAGRPLAYADVDAILAKARPRLSQAMRQRMAVHEAGHALARLLHGIGSIELITLAGPDGTAFVETSLGSDPIHSEDQCIASIEISLAGRAAEEIVFGFAMAGSGGSSASDLARATRVAFAMEACLGFGRRQPLLHRSLDDFETTMRLDRELAARVDDRLEQACASVRLLLGRHREALEQLAEELLRHDTLEGAELARVLDGLALLGREKRRTSEPEP